MGTGVLFQGRQLGEIKLNDNNTNKLVYIAQSLDSLIELFRLNPSDIMEVEGIGNITYQDFKEEYLKTLSGFYPCMDTWLLKDYRAKTIDELEKSLPPLG